MKNLCLLLLLALPNVLLAQITLTAADVPQVGDILTTVNCNVPPGFTIGSAGANQTYDLSMLTPIDTSSVTFIASAGTAGSSEFPDATIAIEDSGDFIYYQQTSDAYFLLGVYSDTSTNNSGQYAAIKWTPPNKIFEIPSTYNTSFTDISAYSFTDEDDSGLSDSIRITNTTEDEVLFDGYGTVITPNGSFNGLRERMISTSTTTVENYVAGMWFLTFTVSNSDTSYNWYANNDIGLASASIDNGVVTDVSYSADGAATSTPVANFSSDDQGAGQLNFTDLSSNSPTSWLWDFGDGTTSSQQNPQHSYNSPGTYLVCLTVSNSSGSDDICTAIEVVFAPAASFTFFVQADGTVDFTDASTNNPTSWFWDFGDGNTSTVQNPQHSYTIAGSYDVCLTVTNSAGSNTFCTDVGIVLTPDAAFTFTGQLTGTVMFTDASTNGPINWLWDFGDGNTSTEQNPQHSYSNSGTYNVCLTSTNSSGSTTVCMDVVVTVAPVATFTFDVGSGGVVDFMDASSNIPTSWFWDFGDGTNSNEQNPQHNYAVAGSYNVCLTATNGAGSSTICMDVVISFAPSAAFTFTGQATGTVNFTDASNNNPTSWAWDFGDGNSSTEQNPQHVYSAPGAYNVCLTVTNNDGSDMVCMDVVVVVAPVAAFTFNTPLMGMVDFTDASSNNPDSWMWDFGDGNTSTEQNPQNTFGATGTYNVCLTVSNSAGSDTFCEDVDVVITATEEILATLNVALFPNPVSDVLFIRLENNTWEMLDFQLVNSLGQSVISLKIPSIGEQLITVGNLTIGLYFYSFTDANGTLRKQGSVLKNDF